MDSRTLFTKQVGAHSQVLCELLACQAGVPVDAPTIERSLVSTRMLAGTSGLMEYKSWEEVLLGYHELLECYKTNGYAWEERVADVTATLIEREESLVGLHEADADVDLGSAVSPEELGAMVAEMAALREEVEAMPPPAPDPLPEELISSSAPAQTQTDPASTPIDLSELGAAEIDGAPSSGSNVPLSGIIGQMRATSEKLSQHFKSQRWNTREWDPSECEDIRRELAVLGFYARTADRIVDRTGSNIQAPVSTLTPLRIALSDFAAELSHASGRELEVTLKGEETQIGPRLLFPAESVLQSMVTDLFSRCEGDSIHVTAQVEERNGTLRWHVSDDGDNFISDSQLDHEDQLAFYPGLKNVRRMLSEHKGVLWVEPGNGRRARFEFTLPVTGEEESLIVWESEEHSFAARASQVCEVIPASTDARGSDPYGEFLEYDSRRVPLFRLDVLFGAAPGDGDMIAVLGSLEKRVAFYVPDCGSPQKGQLLGDSISVWEGPAQPVVQVEGGRVPVVDADAALEHYMTITGTLGSESSSGGGLEELEAFQSQAASPSDAPAPPDSSNAKSGAPAAAGESVEVLVVEQNESMRATLADILSNSSVSAACAGGVEEAMSFISAKAPRLIISEFRMPTMAAKRLVDSLRDRGIAIPVLVTTSQTGQTADLLVEKLGVSGYLSKPLQAEEVTSQISNYLRSDVPT